MGGPATAQMAAASGQGVRGLLIAYRREMMGGGQAPAPVMVPAPVVEPRVVEVEAAPEVKPGLPSFMPEVASRSIASACNRVNVAANASAGPVDVRAASFGDAEAKRVLDEQFCLARAYVIDQGDTLAASVQGFSLAQMRAQCEAFAPTMLPYVARLSSSGPGEVSAAVREFVLGTGAQPARVSGTARICLGIGYGSDNPELALAAGLVLVALGEDPYAEMVGYQVMNGYGAPERPDRGLAWSALAVDALARGATPLVPRGNAGRVEVLSAALAELSGAGRAPVVMDAAAPGGGFGLPVSKAGSN